MRYISIFPLCYISKKISNFEAGKVETTWLTDNFHVYTLTRSRLEAVAKPGDNWI